MVVPALACVAWMLITLPLLGGPSSLGPSNAVAQPSTLPTSVLYPTLVSFLDLIAKVPWVLFRDSYAIHIPLVGLSSDGFLTILLQKPTSFRVLRMDEELVSCSGSFRLSIMKWFCSNFPNKFLTAVWSLAKHPIRPNQIGFLEVMCVLRSSSNRHSASPNLESRS